MDDGASGTPENSALAQEVNARLRADSGYGAARACLFRALGFGAFACLAGIGVGAAACAGAEAGACVAPEAGCLL